ncbi:GMC oxidoreductase [Mucilaginibacter pineti]|uniref:GMC oxidoreductase n=1 Tax=Mucilaginibacter pineti TaxID=1391627 RepID=A0A1G6W9L1_9SPHI|nr:GMC oxidoreductase [Mucilaginibacter pineti]SDD62511.1 GMC oxidoreductase [Mucilaginibacter pineti]
MKTEELKNKYDVCVIGSGPAGIITALEYAKLNPSKDVLLVEYGFKEQPAENQLDNSIKNINPINHHDPYECTNKGLGGSTATWGGRCVTYDEVDFVDRPVVNGGCTWDVSLFNEVNEYLPQTTAYFECGEPVFDLNKIPEFKDQRIAEGFVEGHITDSVVERWSMPTRFGDRYAKEILECPNLFLIDASEARTFSAPEADGTVSTLEIRNVKDKSIRKVNASVFVLAAGTQETTRILLRNQQLFSLLPQPPVALGKYYQGHLSGKIATVRFKGDPKKTDYGFLNDKDGIYLRRRFQFSTKFLVENNLLNTAIWLDNPLYFDPKHKSGAMSFMYLAMITPVLGKKLAPPAIAHSITKGEVKGVGKHIWNVVKDLPGSLLTPASIFYKRYCLKRKLPGVFLFSPQNRYALHFHSEQVPDINNYMELGPDGEELIINYSLTDADIQSVIDLHKELDKWLRDHNCGELEYWFKPEEFIDAIRQMSKDGIHQSGTTRIADSAEAGVVDTDLKLWGTKNVFVCSSSVFPTSGQANPTFYLGAFAVRLANHLTKII